MVQRNFAAKSDSSKSIGSVGGTSLSVKEYVSPASPRLVVLLVASALLLSTFIVILFSFMLRDFAVDDAYITFRHAQNFVRGDGFTFNPGDRLLSTTSPLHGLLLTVLASLGITDLPLAAVWLSATSMLILCLCILQIFAHLDNPLAGAVGILLLSSQHWLYRFFSLETILVLALNAAALTFALRQRWAWSGLIAGIAMVGRPDSIILVGLLVLYAVVAHPYPYKALWRYVGACVLSYGLWLIFAFSYFGSPLPNTLEAKSGFATWTVFLSNIWPKMIRELTPGYWLASAALVGLAGVGFVYLFQKRSPLLLLPLWAFLHTLGYTVLRIAYPFAWYYAPLILITLLLAGMGAVAIIRLASKFQNTYLRGLAWIGSASLTVCLGIIFLLSLNASWTFVSTYETAYYAGARDRVYRDVGRWLAENSDPDASVAMTEVGTIGYFSQRRIIDLMGLVTYELRDLPKQGDYHATIDALRPDYIVAARGLPPDPNLDGFDGYSVVQEFPRSEQNLFEDVVIYAINKE